MLRKHIRGAAGVICLLTLPLGVAAAPSAGDPEQGKAAAAVCASCHQVDGSGQNNPNGESWPRLAGLDAGYIARQLQAYKDGTRQNPSMQAFAQMLDDQQIADVSAWFASLPATAGQPAEAQSHSEELLKRGEQLATEGDWSKYIVSCSSCHGRITWCRTVFRDRRPALRLHPRSAARLAAGVPQERPAAPDGHHRRAHEQ